MRNDQFSLYVASAPGGAKVQRAYAQDAALVDRPRDIALIADSMPLVGGIEGLLPDLQRYVNSFMRAENPEATPQTLIESRMTPASEVLRNRMVSCGTVATLLAAILRAKGIPVKLIHGAYRSSTHAWLEIWDCHCQSWLPYDPMEAASGGRWFGPGHVKLAACRDWTEIRGLLVAEQRRYTAGSPLSYADRSTVATYS